MRVARKLAVRIADFVVLHASAGSREWAEGLAGEVASIPGDWTALRWALGSMRVLVDRRGRLIGSPAEVPDAAYKLVDNLRGGYGIWYLLLQGPVYLIKLFWAPTLHQRCGCALVVSGSMLVCVRLLLDRHWLNEPSKDKVYDDAVTCALFYRVELERLRSTMWIPVASITCWGVGSLEAQRCGKSSEPIYAAIWMLLCVLSALATLHARWLNLRRRDRLDQLLASAE